MNTLAYETNIKPNDSLLGVGLGNEASQVLTAHKTYLNFRQYFNSTDLIYGCKGIYEKTYNSNLENNLGLSGDFISCLPHSETCFSVLVGDVCGHDAGSIRQSIEIQRFLNSENFLEKIKNISLLDSVKVLQSEFDERRNFALTWVKIDLENKTIQSFSAGALRPLIVRKTGNIEHEANYLNPTPMGFPYDPDAKIDGSSEITSFQSGDMIVLTTDGILDSIIGKKNTNRNIIIENKIRECPVGKLSPLEIYSRLINSIVEEEDDLSLVSFRL